MYKSQYRSGMVWMCSIVQQQISVDQNDLQLQVLFGVSCHTVTTGCLHPFQILSVQVGKKAKAGPSF